MTSTGPLRCPTCSTPTVAGARFCHVCGTPLTTERVDEAAERRVVTVLFGDLSDFTAWAEDLDPERVGEVTDRVLAALARMVVEVGGHVDKLTGDGIMAVFGAPTAHEDDAERAVRAAVNMQHEVSRLIADELGGGRRLGLRVGLNTGEVLAGVQAALAYTVVGDTVNTASRLSDAASVGSIYAGRDTAVATMTLASWRALQPLRLKGKREPVAAYELVALRPTSAGQLGLGDEAPFVGREAEIARLVGACLDVSEKASPATIYLSGEAGVGKTRTVGELVRFAGEIPDGRVLLGRAMPYGEGRHLAPLVELVRTACGISDEDEPEIAVERVHRTLARLENPAPSLWVPGALADRLLHLLGIEHDVDGSGARDGSPADPHGRDGVLDATATLLRALAVEGPLLVVIDDLQWASEELLEAIGGVAKRLRGPILLVLIGREPATIADVPSPSHVMLDPLDESTAHRLLRAYLGGGDLADPLRSALLGRAQGNPYFLAELLHLLVDRGLLQREGESWVASGPLPADALPAAVQSVLAARIDGLDPTAKSVLRAASVLGLRFAAEALGVVDQRSTEEVRAALNELTARQLVHPPNKGEIWWTFTHPMARDVAYGSLPKADRARRHARAAQWAAERGARVGSTQVDPFVGAQAEQALALAESMGLPADDPVRRVRFVGYAALVRLGQMARSRDEYRSSAELLARAARLGETDQPKDLVISRRMTAATALASLRRLDEAEAEIGPAVEGATGDLRLAVLVVLGELRQKQGRDAEAVETLTTALTEARAAGNQRWMSSAVRQLGLVDYYAGRLRRAEERFSHALELARAAGDGRGAAWALEHLAWSATTRGDYGAADEALADAAELFGELDDTGGLAWCAGTEALVRVLQGRLADGRATARALIPLAESLAESWGVAMCRTIDALAAAELGDVQAAQEAANLAIETLTDAGDDWGRSFALIASAAASRAAGNPAEALALFEAALESADAGDHALNAAFAYTGAGLAHLEMGNVDEAAMKARQALGVLVRLDLEPHAALGVAVLDAQVRRARGEPEEAVRRLREVLAAAPGSTLLFPRRQALAHLAGSLVDAGRPAEALEVAREAVATPAEDVRSRVLALRALGTALHATGDNVRAEDAYLQALDIAVATQSRSEEAQTRRLIAALAEVTSGEPSQTERSAGPAR
ncbi:MAG TPA: adenylate/guanylate cyclase domain-containing protein [Frankiaceae bacterium]|jgi:class 3 adenylate cyclase/tetratricopeptide (TPR) repeat protein|nr:adenylate/guanylate cyclase domain-containing protein [Frankiaceae bacterium]